jgi:hypothetical protein
MKYIGFSRTPDVMLKRGTGWEANGHSKQNRCWLR